MSTPAQRLAAGEHLFPQPPDITDVHRSQQAVHEALYAPDAVYEAAAAAMNQTEAAFLATLDRERAPARGGKTYIGQARQIGPEPEAGQ